ncbi:circadian clock KaiB family protein [Coleofasciculus sp. LEGE 07092]|nr:circadian clock KaiB family protein [Coleofasciculus sp. LEGE 07081]MBE9149509.1 circadian clock KaiB family protein [Coleofasciculus sp. LEGE 07092]
MVLETYRERFPQLWEDHDLIVRFDRTQQPSSTYTDREFYSPETQPFQDTDYPLEYTHAEDVNREVWQASFSQSPLMKDSVSSDSTRTPGELDGNSEEPNIRSQPVVTHSYVLRLFISGHRRATERTLQKLHELLEHSLRCPYTLTIIDVFKHPDQAEANQISATPTLIRVWPQPVRRIVGDLNNVENLLRIIAAPEC